MKLTIIDFCREYKVTPNQVSMAIHRSKTLNYEVEILSVTAYGGARRRIWILIDEKVKSFLSIANKYKGKTKTTTKTKTLKNGVDVLNNAFGKFMLLGW